MDFDPGGMQKIFQLIRWQGLISALVIAAVAWVLLRSIATTVARLSTRFSERRLFLQQVEAFLRFVIYFVAFFAIVLAVFRFDENLLTVLGGTLIFTAGFALKEQSASGLGSAFAGQTAGGEDISAMFTNPAALTRYPGSRVSLCLLYTSRCV